MLSLPPLLLPGVRGGRADGAAGAAPGGVGATGFLVAGEIFSFAIRSVLVAPVCTDGFLPSARGGLPNKANGTMAERINQNTLRCMATPIGKSKAEGVSSSHKGARTAMRDQIFGSDCHLLPPRCPAWASERSCSHQTVAQRFQAAKTAHLCSWTSRAKGRVGIHALALSTALRPPIVTGPGIDRRDDAPPSHQCNPLIDARSCFAVGKGLVGPQLVARA